MTTIDNLRAHVPVYEQNNVLYNEIFKATAIELNKAGTHVEQNDGELFVDTAIQALDIYERDLGIPKNTLSLSQRREQIIAYFLKNFERITEETLEKIADLYTDGKSKVVKSTVDGIYEIIFSDGSIPYDDVAFQKMMNKIMPAYLAWVMAGRNESSTYTATAMQSGTITKIYPEEV